MVSPAMTTIAKQAAANTAAALVENGMLIGLGTGSTAFWLIKNLGDRCRSGGLNIRALPTSESTAVLAKEEQIPLIETNDSVSLDLAIDGADEIDTEKRMIKGGGGALFRERIVASMAKEMIVIVDESKCVEKLGRFPLPIEIHPFCFQSTIAKLKKNQINGKLRYSKNGQTYITENGNLIYDAGLPLQSLMLSEVENSVKSIPGVIDCGLFIGYAKRVIVGYYDGSVKIYQ